MPPKGGMPVPFPSSVSTRPKNKNAHPGDIHNEYTQKRRTAGEMAEVRSQEARDKTEKQKKQAAALNAAATIEDSMRTEDVQRQTPVNRRAQVANTLAFRPVIVDRIQEGDISEPETPSEPRRSKRQGE